MTVYFGPKPQNPVVLPYIPSAIDGLINQLKSLFAQVYDLGQHPLITQFLALPKLQVAICQKIITNGVTGNVWVAYDINGNPIASFTYGEDRVNFHLAVCS